MIIGDFHIHGRYARACSTTMTIKGLEESARIKGIGILGTGDCLHPKWFEEINRDLEEDENGVLWSKTKFPYLWQTEISLMYSQGGKGRRVHYVLLLPNKEVVIQLRDTILKKWRIDYDGRPIFGTSSIEFLELLHSVSKDIEMIPAHAWTSYFGILGSKSGFDTIKECFQEKTKYIHAIETGMSSDPAMNWRIPELDNYQLVSFSDNHSAHPWRLGREATLFDIKNFTYQNFLQAIRTGEKLQGTIETPPTYGKYHVDGHRACGIMQEPLQTKKVGKTCPKCNKELTIGVAYRVEELATRPEGYQPKNAKPFSSVIPLSELIASIYDVKQLGSKKITEIYQQLIKNFGTEFNILLHEPEEKLAEVVHPKLAHLILQNRTGTVPMEPGYDGVYGKLLIKREDMLEKTKQKKLLDF
ncbi:MAG TPA: endonuclease Q family protein [Candidatus Nanoarchaeia archaeon]|nr:endonuclease Q family protein [Candidatus Nanoarchaeia archaeon]